MIDEKKITVMKNGPYLVNGCVPLAEELIVCDANGTPTSWEPGDTYPDQQNYSLCRCGKSGDKPYCDGTHAASGFSDEKRASRTGYFDEADVIEGPGIDLFDVSPLCVRAGFCHRGGNVWQLAATRSDPASIDIVIADTCDCPSGRLVAAYRSQGKLIEPQLFPSISLIEIPAGKVSGPLWVKGGVLVESVDGWPYEVRNRVTLCRCGASKNMPFCDSSHAAIRFNDRSKAVS